MATRKRPTPAERKLARKRSAAAKQGWATRKHRKRSAAAKQGWATRAANVLARERAARAAHRHRVAAKQLGALTRKAKENERRAPGKPVPSRPKPRPAHRVEPVRKPAPSKPRKPAKPVPSRPKPARAPSLAAQLAAAQLKIAEMEAQRAAPAAHAPPSHLEALDAQETLHATSPRTTRALRRALLAHAGPIYDATPDANKARARGQAPPTSNARKIEAFELERSRMKIGKEEIKNDTREGRSVRQTIVFDYSSPETVKQFFASSESHARAILDYALAQCDTSTPSSSYTIRLWGVGVHTAFSDYEASDASAVAVGWMSTPASSLLGRARDILLSQLRAQLAKSGAMLIARVDLVSVHVKEPK